EALAYPEQPEAFAAGRPAAELPTAEMPALADGFDLELEPELEPLASELTLLDAERDQASLEAPDEAEQPASPAGLEVTELALEEAEDWPLQFSADPAPAEIADPQPSGLDFGALDESWSSSLDAEATAVSDAAALEEGAAAESSGMDPVLYD